MASAAVFSVASITGRARDNPRPSYSVETRRSKIRIGPERKLEPVWVGKGEGGERGDDSPTSKVCPELGEVSAL